MSVTYAEAFQLSDVRTWHERLFTPTERLVHELQQERWLSLKALGGDSSAEAQLDKQRKATDAAQATFRDSVASDNLPDGGSETLRPSIDNAVSRLSALEAGRLSIDGGDVGRAKTAELFNQIIRSAFTIYDAMPNANEPHIGDSHRSVVTLQHAREVLSQEVALVAGALAADQITAAERQSFDRLVGAQRFLFADFVATLPEAEQEEYQQVAGATSLTELRSLEDELAKPQQELPAEDATGQPPTGDLRQIPPPVGAGEWDRAATASLNALRELEASYAEDMLVRADADAYAIYLRAGIILAIGLVLVVVFMTVWIRVAPRHILKSLNGLRDAALSLAEQRLPRVVDQLRRGEQVDIKAAAPPLDFGEDEFGQVGQAFNQVQQTAVQSAIEQAELRSGIRDVFVNLARRSQGLVHRQLSLLDEMERRTSDPDELERLFAVDHLATRMRRHAEDLIILSGSPPGRQWRKPVPLIDVVRSAVGEVEGYARVTILPIGEASLAGRVVADVIHLLAELIENAVSYSPPQTKVRVSGALVPNGFVVEIEDSGLGMTPEDLARYNERLVHPPEFNLSDTVRLGLFVVGRLAQRHGIRIHLRESPYGGTTAIVLIPGSLVNPENGVAAIEGSGLGRPAAIEGVAQTPESTPGSEAPGGVDATAGPGLRPTSGPPSPRPAETAPRFDPGAQLDPDLVSALDAALDSGEPFESGESVLDIGSRVGGAGGALSQDPDLGPSGGNGYGSSTAEGAGSNGFGSGAGDTADADAEPEVRAPEPVAAASPGEYDEPGPAAAPESEAQTTETGLPRRVRQASLANELRETVEPPEKPKKSLAGGRTPEQIRAMMSSFQRGSIRGRSTPPAEGPPEAPSPRPSPRPSTTARDEDR